MAPCLALQCSTSSRRTRSKRTRRAAKSDIAGKDQASSAKGQEWKQRHAMLPEGSACVPCHTLSKRPALTPEDRRRAVVALMARGLSRLLAGGGANGGGRRAPTFSAWGFTAASSNGSAGALPESRRSGRTPALSGSARGSRSWRTACPTPAGNRARPASGPGRGVEVVEHGWSPKAIAGRGRRYLRLPPALNTV